MFTIKTQYEYNTYKSTRNLPKFFDIILNLSITKIKIIVTLIIEFMLIVSVNFPKFNYSLKIANNNSPSPVIKF